MVTEKGVWSQRPGGVVTWDVVITLSISDNELLQKDVVLLSKLPSVKLSEPAMLQTLAQEHSQLAQSVS